MKGQQHLTSYYFQLLMIRTVSILLGDADNEDLTEDKLTNPYQFISL
jgi:hypothetical protein